MNTLNIIKNQIEKAARLHDAQIAMTSYRGVRYSVSRVKSLRLMATSAIAVTPTPSDRHGSITSSRTRVHWLCRFHWYDLW